MLHHAVRTIFRAAAGAPLAAGLLAVSFTAAEAGPLAFVASTGKDTNACTRTAPCRTLQRAHNVADAGGEVQVLNSGNYRTLLRIRKSITISGAGVLATAGRVVIDKGNAVVTLRGLHLHGDGLGDVNGIQISAARAVHIEDCEIERFRRAGIRLGNVSAELFVSDTVSRDNGGSGLAVFGAGNALTKLTVDNSRFENNGDSGIAVEAADSSITRSVAAGNAGQGIRQTGDAGGRMHIESTSASQNADGLFLSAGTMVLESVAANRNQFNGLFVAATSGGALISNSTFTNNGTGINNSGVIATRKNNTLELNTTNLGGGGTVNQFFGF